MPTQWIWVLTALILTGCHRGGEASHPAGRKHANPRHFYRSLTEPETLDPGLCSETQGGQVIGDLFEGLYVAGPDHQTWVPGVAVRHEISPDGLTWTFHLRPAKWSDGVALTARDFEWSWKRALDPATASRNAGALWFLAGAKAYNQSAPADRARLRAAVGVKALDERTLRVRLRAPTPFFKQLTTLYTYAPVPRHVIERYTERWTRPGKMVSNGPWRLAKFTPQQRIVLTTNPNYYAPKQVPFDRIEYSVAQDDQVSHRMYLSGELDFLSAKLPASVLPRYRAEGFAELKSSPFLGVYYYEFNLRRRPFDDVRVRRALGLAINKALIGELVVKGGQRPAWSLVHPGLKDLGYRPPPADHYDPKEARRLLAAAGYPGGAGFPKFRLSYNTSQGHRLIAEFIQQAWRKTLGVHCELENMEWKVLLQRGDSGAFDLMRSSWVGDYLDPSTFLSLFESDNPNNISGWRSAEYDRLMALAARSPDPAARLRRFAEAEQILLAEQPVIPLYYYQRHDLVKPWVLGYRPHLQGIHLSRWFKISK